MGANGCAKAARETHRSFSQSTKQHPLGFANRQMLYLSANPRSMIFIAVKSDTNSVVAAWHNWRGMHDLYLATDVLALADIIEEFRRVMFESRTGWTCCTT